MSAYDLKWFQEWLNAHGAQLVADGKGGPKTRAAIIETFRNLSMPRISASLGASCTLPSVIMTTKFFWHAWVTGSGAIWAVVLVFVLLLCLAGAADLPR